jgi:hypothetical protein
MSEPKARKMDDDMGRRWHFIVNSEMIVALYQEIASLLNEGADPNLTNSRTGQTYVQFVCSMERRLGATEVALTLELFLNRPNFNVNHIDGYGLALIHYCVQMHDPRFLALLLQRRRDVYINAQTDNTSWSGVNGRMQAWTVNGRTALNLLFLQSTPRQVKLQLLMDNGANPNIIGVHTGFGPIHNLIVHANYCVQPEITDNIRLLLAPRPHNNDNDNDNDNNADPNLRVEGGDFVGFTPLHIAVHTRCKKYVLDALLECGADARMRDNAGRTPLEYARLLKKPEIDPAILELLWKNGPEFHEVRRYAERVLWRPTHGNSEIYQRILEEGGLHPPRRPPR